MSEIKISLSPEMDKIIQNICKKIGMKKTEFVKSLIIEDLKNRGSKGK